MKFDAILAVAQLLFYLTSTFEFCDRYFHLSEFFYSLLLVIGRLFSLS